MFIGQLFEPNKKANVYILYFFFEIIKHQTKSFVEVNQDYRLRLSRNKKKFKVEIEKWKVEK